MANVEENIVVLVLDLRLIARDLGNWRERSDRTLRAHGEILSRLLVCIERIDAWCLDSARELLDF